MQKSGFAKAAKTRVWGYKIPRTGLIFAGPVFGLERMAHLRYGRKRIEQVADLLAGLLVAAFNAGCKFDFGLLIFHGCWILAKGGSVAPTLLTSTIAITTEKRDGLASLPARKHHLFIERLLSTAFVRFVGIHF
jgi:hypothetical protein